VYQLKRYVDPHDISFDVNVAIYFKTQILLDLATGTVTVDPGIRPCIT